MDKFSKIKQEILELQVKKSRAAQILETCDSDINIKKNEMAKLYQDFFDNKKKKDFILYNRFPSLELLKEYAYMISDEHPMSDYGLFNIKELVEIIKLLYQYQRQEEFYVLTIGKNYKNGIPVYQGQVFNLTPQLFFIIGNTKSLQAYKEYNGMFLNDDFIFDFEDSYGKKNIVAVNAMPGSYRDQLLNIECLTSNFNDKRDKINYFDYINGGYGYFDFSANINIYVRYLKQHFYKYKGVKDVLDIDLDINDSFIAKALISISIYKKNNGLIELGQEDYNYIFNTLFGENIDLSKEIEKDIPKTLKYVPNNKYNL